jgi:hypothetical protein
MHTLAASRILRPASKFMVHILLSFYLLSGKSIIHCGEHAIRIIECFEHGFSVVDIGFHEFQAVVVWEFSLSCSALLDVTALVIART